MKVFNSRIRLLLCFLVFNKGFYCYFLIYIFMVGFYFVFRF